MGQIGQFAGVAAILAAFLLTQTGRSTTRAVDYLLLNLVGGVLLGISALTGRQWGFVVLESVWSVVALWGLIRRPQRAGITPTTPN